MTECEFSVIKYVPDIARFEPVNIGIALLDKKNKQMYNKYITNFNGFFKRLGVEKINGLEASFKNYRPASYVDSTNYLWDLHHSFHGSVMYSEPIRIDVQDVSAAVQQVFDNMISIHEKQEAAKDAANVTATKIRIRKHIKNMCFPENSYKEKFGLAIKPGMPQIRRDFAFVRGRELRDTINVFDLSKRAVSDGLKLFWYEMRTIRQSEKYKKSKPWIFSTAPVEYEKLADSQIADQDTIVDPRHQKEKLEEIRSSLI